jgi:hypothetical protein
MVDVWRVVVGGGERGGDATALAQLPPHGFHLHARLFVHSFHSFNLDVDVDVDV